VFFIKNVKTIFRKQKLNVLHWSGNSPHHNPLKIVISNKNSVADIVLHHQD